MIDDAQRRRVQALFHALSLDWDNDKRAVETETPIQKVERLSKQFRETPCVASPELLTRKRTYSALYSKPRTPSLRR
jgi:hypothetical protein